MAEQRKSSVGVSSRAGSHCLKFQGYEPAEGPSDQEFNRLARTTKKPLKRCFALDPVPNARFGAHPLV